MAGMSLWLAATLGMLPAFVVPAVAAGLGGMRGRLVAVQLASAVATLILIAMTFAFDQPSFVDLALALTLLTLPGSLLLALFVERWL